MREQMMAERGIVGRPRDVTIFGTAINALFKISDNSPSHLIHCPFSNARPKNIALDVQFCQLKTIFRVRRRFRVKIVSTTAVAIIATIHIAISIVEIFLWKNPSVYQRLDYNAEIAAKVAPIVENAGLYNSFIAAGLIWGTFAKSNSLPIRVFFLVCVIIAGVFGALTLKRTTFVIQTLPAFLALLLVVFTQDIAKSSQPQ